MGWKSWAGAESCNFPRTAANRALSRHLFQGGGGVWNSQGGRSSGQSTPPTGWLDKPLAANFRWYPMVSLALARAQILILPLISTKIIDFQPHRLFCICGRKVSDNKKIFRQARDKWVIVPWQSNESTPKSRLGVASRVGPIHLSSNDPKLNLYKNTFEVDLRKST